MEKPQLHPNLIIRTPRFPIDSSLKECWPVLQQLIFESSPEFGKKIQHLSFEQLLTTEHEIQITVAKYFNRSKFRATPYGSFAGVGASSFGNDKKPITIPEDDIRHSFKSIKNSDNVVIQKKDFKTGNLKFHANTTHYLVDNQIRFLKKEEGEFQISAIEYDPDILKILKYCSEPKYFSEITQQFPYAVESTEDLIHQLLSAQLLLSSRHENVIGEDYFLRIGQTQFYGDQEYTISERTPLQGNLFSGNFRYLPDLILKLKQIKNPIQNENLKSFIDRFVQRFEGLEVPLLVALDPELGVGYGNFEKSNNGSLKDRFVKDKESDTTIKEISKNYLFELFNAIEKGEDLNIENLTAPPQSDLEIPNTTSVLCKEINGKIYIDSIGGATATSLIGRFAHAVPEIYHMAMEIVSLEEKLNPDVIFFDIGYSCERDVDDINRRPSVYNFELNIINYPSSSAKQILPNDILVSIRDRKVILLSKSLGKRIIPRFSSAYNYSRSNLSLFRFLLDIQSQGLLTDLTYRPIDLVPGLAYYPRASFRNIIVAQAMLKLISTQFINPKSNEVEFSNLINYILKKFKYGLIKVGASDQTLLLNCMDQNDLIILGQHLKRKKELYIEEAELPSLANTVNTSNRPFLSQLHIVLLNKKQLYSDIHLLANDDSNPKNRQWIAPGGDWLYLEFFGLPMTTDSILNEVFAKAIQKQRHQVLKWFFIRYNEGGDHIRLRINFKTKAYFSEFLLTVNTISEMIQLGSKVLDFSIRTYKKEIHRYSSRLMPKIETHFCKDSAFVISLYKLQLTELQKINLCLETLRYIKFLGIFRFEDFQSLVIKMKTAYNSEFQVTHQNLKTINAISFERKAEQTILLSKLRQQKYSSFKKSLAMTLRLAFDHERPKLFVDLFHMHINRLFVTDQRYIEMLIYNFAEIEIKKEQGRRKYTEYNLRA